jgi:hypothetical protein
MRSRNLLASMAIACALAVGCLGTAQVAHAGSSGEPTLKRGKSAKDIVIDIKRRGRAPRIHLPIGPSSVYYDYPYYYSRGYYPTHIGGYVYYPYHYYRRYYWGGHRRPAFRQRG